MLTLLQNNKQQFGKSSVDILRSSKTIKKGKLLDRIKDASKKDRREIINEWILEEIKKINKAAECEDF